ncbi:SdpA family antimicrobial peptide system protein [Flavobacterium sp. NST-5]|uniref:SdpA family antimicrobial peptide system protein n=1 Tax=Flavobacterium ichthyis TaxID=2698827 RepID=A0ABW9Z8X4_9FLAO|nr:SdpA family antimicrobial peptide system protein [Flavobacterium ichthyis]NBL65069.1 SdpA family antimicrobial peptide system protein [Flavobacterium ichthyis]
MKKSIFYVFTVFVSILFLYNLFFASLSYNAQTPNYPIKKILSKTLPEGWGFFTKSPREAGYTVYVVNQGNLELLETRNTSSSNYFGLSRKARKISMEVSIVTDLVATELWQKKSDLSHINLPENLVEIDSKNLHFLKNHDLVVVKSYPIPWAWKEIVQPNQIPYEIVRIKT